MLRVRGPRRGRRAARSVLLLPLRPVPDLSASFTAVSDPASVRWMSRRVEGHCDSEFERVRDAFENNLASEGELGGSVCVRVAGRTVVDIWGGHRAPRTNALVSAVYEALGG